MADEKRFAILIDADNKETVQGFISDEDYAGFVADDSRYAVAAVEDNRLYGVGIFEARKTAEILDVIVADDKKGDLYEDRTAERR